MTKPIVVGVDGSQGAEQAVAWATREAVLRDAPLLLVHASKMLVRDGSLSEDAYGRLEAERQAMLGRARARVLKDAPGLVVDLRVAAGDPGFELVATADQAQLLVVGARGTGGFERLLLGSVSLYAAAHAGCPIVTMPTIATVVHERAPVVLGADEKHDAGPAIGWAFEEADRRGADLVVLHGVTGGYGAPRQEIGEQLELAEAVAGWEPKFPGLRVVHQVVPKSPAKALVEASETASLLVVGARRRHGIVGMALGRVNHAVLHHSRSPIVIVPEQ
jgi:nucleotide-binding universal stress UspA family protein